MVGNAVCAPGAEPPRNRARSAQGLELWPSHSRLISASAPRDDDNGADEQLDVAPERPVSHVQVVQVDHVLERDVRSAMDLPEAGQPGHEVAPAAEAPSDP